MKLLKKLSLFLVMFLFINNINIINSKAETSNISSKDTVEEFNNIVIFADFSDSTENFMTSERINQIIDMYNGTSVKALSNYISAISNGKVKVNNYFPQLVDSSITPYRLPKARDYYKSHEYEMIKEIINNVKVDSSISLDGNNDGEVDNVTFIFPGGADNSLDVFWPHKHQHNYGSSINGKYVNVYNIQNEESLFTTGGSAGKGVIAHEFLHSLGLPDLYRSSGTAVPVGRWDIMANVHSSFLQYPLTYLRKQWVNLETITSSGTYTLNLATSKEGTQGMMIKTLLSEKEFFVVEYRKEGNSYKDELEAKIPGTGLVIYRVNTEKNTNFTGPKDYIYVFRPGETGEGNGAGDLTKSFLSLESGRTSYGSSDMNAKISDGAITYSSGENSGIVIRNVGSTSGDTITFDIEIPNLSNVGVWDILGGSSINTIESNQASMDVVGSEVYVSYSEGYGSKKLKVAKFNGTNWVDLSTGLSNNCYNAKIKIYNGVPYIIYNKYNSNYEYKLYAAKFENGSWSTIQEISDGDSQDSEMISTENGLYITYTDSGSGILKVSKLNITTNKFEQIGNNVDTGYIYGLSLTEENGKIYVSYSNFYKSDKISVKKYNEGTWNEAASLDVTAKFTSINSVDGKVYLAVGDDTVQVYELKDNSWTKLGSDIAGSESLYPKIAVLDNMPYITYVDTNKGEIKLKLFNGSEWLQEGYRVTDKEGNNINFIIENGIGYISYLDESGLVEVRTRKLKDVSIEPEYELEDVNKDGVINILDLSQVAFKYNIDSTSNLFEEALDINKDSIVDIFDLVLVSRKMDS